MHSMLGKRETRLNSPARIPKDLPPLLFVIVDTEEEFDWNQPLSRNNTQVKSMRSQCIAQEIFAANGIRPTYVIDYPVATNAEAVETLLSYYKRGLCEVGAHLHPWVNPPHQEPVTPHNSYPGNLPSALEGTKLETLTQAIKKSFGIQPEVYKAGRYGIGPATAQHLANLGYKVDVSVVPYTSFRSDGGPNFYRYDPFPYWFGRDLELLEIPLCCSFTGALFPWGASIYPLLAGPVGMKARLPGIAARLGLLERIRLSPEGHTFDDLRRLTDHMIGQGCQIFSFTFHSPSLEAGNTPYVRDIADLHRFQERIERYCRYFMNDVGGISMTPLEFYDLVRKTQSLSL